MHCDLRNLSNDNVLLSLKLTKTNQKEKERKVVLLRSDME